MTRQPSRLAAIANSRPSSPEPSSIKVARYMAGGDSGAPIPRLERKQPLESPDHAIDARSSRTDLPGRRSSRDPARQASKTDNSLRSSRGGAGRRVADDQPR